MELSGPADQTQTEVTFKFCRARQRLCALSVSSDRRSDGLSARPISFLLPLCEQRFQPPNTAGAFPGYCANTTTHILPQGHRGYEGQSFFHLAEYLRPSAVFIPFGAYDEFQRELKIDVLDLALMMVLIFEAICGSVGVSP